MRKDKKSLPYTEPAAPFVYAMQERVVRQVTRVIAYDESLRPCRTAPIQNHKYIDVRAGLRIASSLRAEEHQADKARPVEGLKPSPQLCDQAL